jgi:adenylate kinase family enzyme
MNEKIVIIGNAGGGKSTLAKAISSYKKIPLYRLDKLQWNPGWVPTPEKKFDRLHDTILLKPEWIIDGFASWRSIEKRFASATTIIFVDLPLWIHLWWATKRQFFCLFRPRPDFIKDCPMIPMTGKLYKMILTINKEYRPKLLELTEKYKEKKEILHIRTTKQLNALLTHFDLNRIHREDK